MIVATIVKMVLCRNNNIKVGKNNLYMDDIRAFLKALTMSWRWVDGSLCQSETWRKEDEDSGLSANCLVAMMNQVYSFLKFTVELGEDFSDGFQVRTPQYG